MKEISDDILIEELKRKLSDSHRAFHDLQVVTKKLETLNAKLADSEALKSHFLSNIRLEINNPLTSILGIARQITGSTVDHETAQRMAQMIHNEAFDLDFQLRNIFIAAELEAGEAALSLSNVDIGMLIRDMIDSFSHRAFDKNVTMDILWNVQREAGIPFYFRTDPEKLDRIISNLLANAIEFNKDGKLVTITIAQANGQLIISVEDEGIGISDEQLASLFSRFKQFDSGVRKAHRGHGLGLSITKALTEMLEGTISFARTERGGCVFTIIIKESKSGTDIETLSEEGNEFIF